MLASTSSYLTRSLAITTITCATCCHHHSNAQWDICQWFSSKVHQQYWYGHTLGLCEHSEVIITATHCKYVFIRASSSNITGQANSTAFAILLGIVVNFWALGFICSSITNNVSYWNLLHLFWKKYQRSPNMGAPAPAAFGRHESSSVFHMQKSWASTN